MHFRDWSSMYKHNSNFILRRFYEVYKAAAVYHVQLKTHLEIVFASGCSFLKAPS